MKQGDKKGDGQRHKKGEKEDKVLGRLDRQERSRLTLPNQGYSPQPEKLGRPWPWAPNSLRPSWLQLGPNTAQHSTFGRKFWVQARPSVGNVASH